MENNRKNILIIIPHLYGGGAERVATQLANYLDEYYNVRVVTFEKWGEKKYDYKYNVELICINLKGGDNPFKKIYTLIKRVLYLRKIKKEYEIDVSISFLDNANIVNVLSKRKEKVITSIRSLLSARSTSKVYKTALKLISHLSTYIVTLSDMVKIDLCDNFNLKDSNIVTIYNPCDINAINDMDEQSAEIDKIMFENDNSYIVTMGRLMKPKGHWHLLKAFKYVNDSLPNTRLIILGEGELRNKLEKLAFDLKIENFVLFPGFVSNPFSIIRRCDLFVFTSIYEGLGNAIIEALACRKAVISTDCDAGPREILAPSTKLDYKTKEIEYSDYGVLVPAFPITKHMEFTKEIEDNEVILAKAIQNILFDSNLKNYYENKSYERALDFSVLKIMHEWIKLIEN